MLVINSIDKTRLSGDTFAYSGDGVAWKARVVLFMGFAAMAGGLAGGVTVMVLKYVTEGATGMSLWFGAANLAANALVMLRYVVDMVVVVAVVMATVDATAMDSRISAQTLTCGQLGGALGQPEHGGRLHLQLGSVSEQIGDAMRLFIPPPTHFGGHTARSQLDLTTIQLSEAHTPSFQRCSIANRWDALQFTTSPFPLVFMHLRCGLLLAALRSSRRQ